MITDMNIRFLAPWTELSLCPASIDLHDANHSHIALAQVTDILLGVVNTDSKTE